MNAAAFGSCNCAVVPRPDAVSGLAGPCSVVIVARSIILWLDRYFELVAGDGDSNCHTRDPSHQSDVNAVSSRQAGDDVKAQGGVEGETEDGRLGEKAVDLTHPDFGHANAMVGDGEEVALLVKEPGYPDPVGGW